MFLLQDAQHVLGCQWISGNISCYVSPGYRFNYAVSHNVILEIPRASVEQTGTYTCKTDDGNTERKSCDLRLTLCETRLLLLLLSLHRYRCHVYVACDSIYKFNNVLVLALRI